MRLRRLIVPLVAVALGVTACGGGDTPDADETPTGDEAGDEPSADDSDDADAEGESGEDEPDAGQDGDEVDAVALFGAIAAATVEAGSYEFETTMDAAGQDMSVSGAIQVGTEVSEANMRITSDVLGQETEMLVVDGQVFMELTEDMGFPGGGSWFTVDPEADDQLSQLMAESFEQIGSATDLTTELTAHPDLLTVTLVGSATIDGVETTEYFVTVDDIAAFTDADDADVPLSELSYSMWIDGDNLPRRMTTDAGGSASIDVTYSNYGADVDVQAPPADEVIDLSEMMNQ